MPDELFEYYERELLYLRGMGELFARAHPKIAGRLRMGAGEIEDPHVARLIQAIAFLNARTHLRVDQQLPHLSSALLEALYPEFLAPLPSMGIVELLPATGTAGASRVPRKTEIPVSRLSIEKAHVQPIYSTCFDTLLLPLRIEAAELGTAPFDAPTAGIPRDCAWMLHIVIKPLEGAKPLAEILPDFLRFYLAGEAGHGVLLYELLFANLEQVVIATGSSDLAPLVLGPEAVTPVGFDPEETLWPRSSRSQAGYHLLTEYLAFPNKFLFVDLHGDYREVARRAQGDVHIYLFFRSPVDDTTRRGILDLQQHVDERSFVLGCTPVINLFEKTAESIKLDHERRAVLVLPDSRRPRDFEVYAIEDVIATNPIDGISRMRPMHGLDHRISDSREPDDVVSRGGFYRVLRRSGFDERPMGDAAKKERTGKKDESEKRDEAADVYLEVVEADLGTFLRGDTTLAVSTLCTNRDLPSRLPPREGLEFDLPNPAGSVGKVKPLTSMTPPRRPTAGKRNEWGLISNFVLDQISLTGGADGAEVLREILRMHDFVSDPGTRALIDSVTKVESRGTVLRVVQDGRAAYMRGLEIRVELDERRILSQGAFLFSAVLDRFFALYCSINSFVQTIVYSNIRGREIAKWPARCGSGPLV